MLQRLWKYYTNSTHMPVGENAKLDSRYADRLWKALGSPSNVNPDQVDAWLTLVTERSKEGHIFTKERIMTIVGLTHDLQVISKQMTEQQFMDSHVD